MGKNKFRVRWNVRTQRWIYKYGGGWHIVSGRTGEDPDATFGQLAHVIGEDLGRPVEEASLLVGNIPLPPEMR